MKGILEMNVIITNGGIFPDSADFLDRFNSDRTVYEVIRIIDGVALFLEDHFTRLLKSMEIQGIPFEMELPEYKHWITELVEQNHKSIGNVKFVYSFVQNESQWAFAFIPHSYPEKKDYLTGVSTDLLFAERDNPNAKVIQGVVRDRANQLIDQKNLYEVLLVDQLGEITEGSRSNVFFVKGETFYTAPASKVLVGITRQKVIECLIQLGFRLVEQTISFEEMNHFDAVFLTGTSPKILPVLSVGDLTFTVQLPEFELLMGKYNQLIEDYISQAKSTAH